MSIEWQSLVAICVVIAAGLSLIRTGRKWLAGQSRGGCGACPSKTEEPSGKVLPIVQIQRRK